MLEFDYCLFINNIYNLKFVESHLNVILFYSKQLQATFERPLSQLTKLCLSLINLVIELC